MQQVAELAEGAQVYADHAEWYPVVRKVEHLLGKLQNVSYNKKAKEVRADAILLAGALGDKVLAVAESMPEMLGFSIVAEGLQEELDEEVIVTEITQLQSVDVVTKPATVTSLFESIKPKSKLKLLKDEAGEDDGSTGAEEKTKDELEAENKELADKVAELESELEALKADAAVVVSDEDDSDDSDESKRSELEAENAELKQKVADLAAEIEVLKAEKAAADERAKAATTEEAFRAAGLNPKDHATLCEFLRSQPQELRDKAIKELKTVTARALNGLPDESLRSAMMGGAKVTESCEGAVSEADVDKVVSCFRS